MCRPLVRCTLMALSVAFTALVPVPSGARASVRRLTPIHTRSSEQVVDPDRTSVEIDNQDPIFHVLYGLGDRDTG